MSSGMSLYRPLRALEALPLDDLLPNENVVPPAPAPRIASTSDRSTSPPFDGTKALPDFSFFVPLLNSGSLSANGSDFLLDDGGLKPPNRSGSSKPPLVAGGLNAPDESLLVVELNGSKLSANGSAGWLPGELLSGALD